MIFVLGILTLLALVGLILIARTHGDFQRISTESTAASYGSAMNGVVRTVQETLRRDVWGSDRNPPAPLLNTGSAMLEKNEPFDAPGIDDRWLASLQPFDAGTALQAGSMTTVPPATGNAGLAAEQDVPVWPYVSYLGTDLRRIATVTGKFVNPFMWPDNTRTPAVNDVTVYGDPVRNAVTGAPASPTRSSLEKVPVLQTPPPAFMGLRMIPGATTNVTIAEARARWRAANWSAVAPAPAALSIAEFPYFDTNADGIIDLYDADGDGVPDSPLSFAVPMDSRDANMPRALYAAIRVVDHGAMLNVNVASSLRLPGGGLMFNEGDADYQRRGRRMTELLLDDAVHDFDRLPDASLQTRTAELVRRRWNDPTDPDARAYDNSVVRRLLAGGTLTGLNYLLYGLGEEASLRHRGMLVPFDRRNESSAPAGDYSSIDKALRGTLLWSREVDATNRYQGPQRWTRLSANYEPIGTPGLKYDGYDDPGNSSIKGWRTMLREDEPYALNRALFTTVSHDVTVPPDITRGMPAPPPNQSNVDIRLQQLWALGMDWPTLIDSTSALAGDAARPSDAVTDSFLVAPDKMPPDWARPLAIDLNFRSAADPVAAKQAMLRYAAAGMYLALDPANFPASAKYQGIAIDAANAANREYLAWQFALNLVDYRDDDDAPSSIEWPTGSGRRLFGLELQPFFTEAYAYLIAGMPPGLGPGAGPSDQWFFAVELFVPPYWQVSTNNLFLRVQGGQPSGLIALSNFLQVASNSPPPPVIDGGPTGQYVVLCGNTAHAPASILATTQFQQFYRNNALAFAKDGTAKIELVYAPSGIEIDPATHVIDVIGGEYTAGALDSYTSAEYGGDPSTGFANRRLGLNIGEKLQMSLLRGTNGWKFTTGWQVYNSGLVGLLPGAPGPAGVQQSLGRSNEPAIGGAATARLELPASPWPARSRYGGGPFPDPFGNTGPFNAFDSPAELGELMMIGHLRLPAALPPTVPGTTAPAEVPVTLLMARMVDSSVTSSSDLPAASDQRVAVGRPDFNPQGTGAGIGSKLFGYFTAKSALFDGINNDGVAGIDMADPAEAVLFRNEGRINVNTAPPRVLRAIPFMSLLPTSSEYLFHVTPVTNPFNPYQEFNSAPAMFWDLASTIVAKRENRNVALRLWDSDPGQLRMRQVGVTNISGALLPGAPGSVPSYAFKSPAELARLVRSTTNPDQFDIRRFAANSALVLGNHKLSTTVADPDLGPRDVLSPDYRFSRINGTTGYVDHAPMATAAPVSPGIRARDVLFTRIANMLTTRSDVFTAYIALIDEQGNYVQRCQVTLDRSDCFREREMPVPAAAPKPEVHPILPRVLCRQDSSYTDDTK